MPTTLSCKVCGAPFTVPPSRADRIKTCSVVCGGLYRRKPLLSPDELLAKLEANSMPIPFSGCMVWLGATNNGYGRVYAGGGRDGLAHCLAHEARHGPIQDGLELDHLCSVRSCWEDAHLEPVTHQENLRRGMLPPALRGEYLRRPEVWLCRQGHEISGDNETKDRNGNRRCRSCLRAWERAAYHAARNQMEIRL